MTNEERIYCILALLDEEYGPKAACYLNFDPEKPWQLLFATILSAQCTDDRVNIVTPPLFAKYPTLEAFAQASIEDVEDTIRSIGFFRNKAKGLVTTARLLLQNHGGVLPSDIDALTALASVGRKTANVVRGHIFDIPSVVVDTHVKRISKKLGLAQHEDPVKIEFELMNVLPQQNWTRFNTQLIAHGRKVCKARRPDCNNCILSKTCPGINRV